MVERSWFRRTEKREVSSDFIKEVLYEQSLRISMTLIKRDRDMEKYWQVLDLRPLKRNYSSFTHCQLCDLQNVSSLVSSSCKHC